jgi:hypothetical protein
MSSRLAWLQYSNTSSTGEECDRRWEEECDRRWEEECGVKWEVVAGEGGDDGDDGDAESPTSAAVMPC